MLQDRTRKREVHRYYQPWLETFRTSKLPVVEVVRASTRADGYIPQSSQDRALTAFAQLGCLRLNVKRGIVTLIGTTQQYILAEATKSLSLLQDSQHSDFDEIWFGNAVIPRKQGISAAAMEPDEYTAAGPGDEIFKAPALVIPDISIHEKYKDRGYAGKGVNFYAGVPITTRSGHPIGVYTVTDDKPRDGLGAAELRFMTDMAQTVVVHLEAIKNDRARARGERLIEGIGDFIKGTTVDGKTTPVVEEEQHREQEGKQTVSFASEDEHSNPPASSEPTADFKGITVSSASPAVEETESQSMLRHRSNSSNHHCSPTAPPNGKRSSKAITVASKASDESKGHGSAGRQAQKEPPSKYKQIYDRAAMILRRSTGADGVMFLNASSANLSSGSIRTKATTDTSTRFVHTGNRKNNSSEMSSDSETNKSGASRMDKDASQSEGSGLDDRRPTRIKTASRNHQQDVKDKFCEILGSSQGTSPMLPGEQAYIDFPENRLRRMVRRYPEGKWFSFTRQGNITTSDDCSESTARTAQTQQDNSDEDESTNRPSVRVRRRHVVKSLVWRQERCFSSAMGSCARALGCWCFHLGCESFASDECTRRFAIFEGLWQQCYE